MNIKTILKITIILITTFIIAGYSYYRTKDFIEGPVVTINYPSDGETIYSPVVEITGTAKNISYITLDDRQIYTDESGNFSEKLLLYPGYNIISIKVRDKFDRQKEKVLEVVYKSKNGPLPQETIEKTNTATSSSDSKIKLEQNLNIN